MLVVHLGTVVTAQFALVDESGEIIQTKSASVDLGSTRDPAPWEALRGQVQSLRAQIQAQATPTIPPAAPAATDTEESVS